MHAIRTLTYRFGDVHYDFVSRTHIMGILNITPDSFYDGNKFFTIDQAIGHALQMEEEGADFIDIGGESTRPGSDGVSSEDELHRVIPVIEKLTGKLGIPISIDTCKAGVAECALKAGAVIVNDISGLRFDSRMADVIANSTASVIVMHIKGTPKTMQTEPEYSDLIGEIYNYLQESIRIAEEKGINQIIVDPGIGFGKTVEHNLQIIKNLKQFQCFGYPVLVGPSRKSFLGKILGLPADDRLEGTAAAVAVSIMNGAHIVRVHDVRQMKRIAGIVDAVVRA
jgi:dihydropteroate synthase